MKLPAPPTDLLSAATSKPFPDPAPPPWLFSPIPPDPHPIPAAQLFLTWVPWIVPPWIAKIFSAPQPWLLFLPCHQILPILASRTSSYAYNPGYFSPGTCSSLGVLLSDPLLFFWPQLAVEPRDLLCVGPKYLPW